MVTTPKYPQLNLSAQYLEQSYFGGPTGTLATESLNSYWQQTSFGQTSATGQVFGPFMLSQEIDCSSSDFFPTQAIVNAADSSVDWTQFTHVSIVFPGTGCVYGGFANLGYGSVVSPTRGTVTDSLSVNWATEAHENDPNWLTIICHELGHNLGINHANSEDYGAIPLGALDDPGVNTEYGGLYSPMGSYNNGQYEAEHQSSIIGWMRPGNYLEVSSSGSFNVHPLENMTDPRALRILRDPASSAWLWLEYKQPIGDMDASLAATPGTNIFKGALIHYENPQLDSPGHTYLLTFNPVAAPNNFANSTLQPGSSWSDPYSPLSLSVNSADAGGLSVTVNYDQPCATVQFSSTVFSAGGTAGSVSVTAPGDCAWTASTATPWITLSGSTSGRGNGTVDFTAAANAAASQRNGYISVGPQSTPVVQVGSGLSALGVSPVLGTGTSGTYTFAFNDASGYADITGTTMILQRAGGASPGGTANCQISANPKLNALYLFNDAGNSQLGPLSLSSPGGTLSNGVCLVHGAGSSILGTGNTLQVTVQVDFSSAFTGAHKVVTSATGGAGSVGNTTVGTWIVPVNGAGGTFVTIQSNVPGAPFSVDNGSVYQAPATFAWTAGAQHTIIWLASLPGTSGARYVFQNWSDGVAGARIITVPGSAVTYSANVKAQFLLSVTQVPAAGGSFSAAPSSTDGFYDAGTLVQIIAAPASGYKLASFGGDGSGSTVTMGSPHTVIANFSCQFSSSGLPLNSPQGPGASLGLLEIVTGAGCNWAISSNAAWLTFGGAPRGTGSGSVPYSIASNTGTSRTAVVTISGDIGSTINATQDASTSSRPWILSLSPAAGSGASQVFTVQASFPSGQTNITLSLVFSDPLTATNQCSVAYSKIGGSSYLFLLNDDNKTSSYLLLPSTGTLANSRCQTNASQFTVSSSGTAATVQFGITFLPSFFGARVISAMAQEATGVPSALFSPLVTLGQWAAGSSLPSITAGGVVPVFSTANTIQPGSWVSLYGSNLASATTLWKGDFPTLLGGVSVTIDSKPAYLWFVGAGQINLQVPDDTALGTVPVVVTNANGSFTSSVTLARVAPSFLLLADGKHATAIVATPGSPGNSGAGYDVIGPSRPVKAGEIVILYGTGFGPTNPPVPSGESFSGAAAALPSYTPNLTIGGVAVPAANILFSGLVSAGLYQINLLVPPSPGGGDQPLVATVGGSQTQNSVFISVQ